MPAAKLFGEPSRLSQNVGHCKCIKIFYMSENVKSKKIKFSLSK